MMWLIKRCTSATLETLICSRMSDQIQAGNIAGGGNPMIQKTKALIKKIIMGYNATTHCRDIQNIVTNNNIIPGAITYGDGNNLTIGTNVSFGGDVLLYGSAPIIIGDHTMIAYKAIIHTSTHDYNNHPMWIERIDRPVKIGQHVWIGVGAIVLAGVKIGDYSVVGAGCIVNAHVPPYAVVAGNPARIIRFRNKKAINLNENIDCSGAHALTKSYLATNKIVKIKE